MRFLVLAVMMLTPTTYAQEAAKVDKAPIIPVELKAEMFKAQAQQQTAQVALDQAQKVYDAKLQAWQQVVAKVGVACGTKHVPQWDAQGDPVCTPKPVAKPEEKK